MLSLPPSVRIFVAREPVDMRGSFDRLASLAIEVIDGDPQSGHLFVFFGKRRHIVKILWWDRSGYVVLSKRLEHGRFKMIERVSSSTTSFEMRSSELQLILEGIDLRGARHRLTHDEIFSRA